MGSGTVKSNRVVIFFAVISLLASGFSPRLIESVYATDTSSTAFVNGQHYNSLIPDGNFVDINALGVSGIQSFLASKGSYLASAPPSQLGANNNGRSAAQIIWDAAHGYGEASGTLNGIVVSTSTGTVSPQVLLSTLQKEQSLVTRSEYNERALDCAMGYEGGNGCQWMFDNKPNWKGFTNQVEWGAWQLRYNYERAQGHGFSDYQVGQTSSFSDGTGIYAVTFSNRSTASLFRYTPHVFNGNYNFWKNIVEWFGILGGGGGGANVNDTSTVEATTYRSSFKVAGSKTTDVRAYFEGGLVADLGGTRWEKTFEPTIGRKDYRIEYKNSGGAVVASKLISVDRRKVGDVNGDGKVELLDVSVMSDAWGQNVQGDAWINLNPDVDNIVDLLDLSLLANNFEG